MLHQHRIWCVSTVEDADELVTKLQSHTWCLCTGFRFGNTLWLNDSTSEDAIQEYAVVRATDGTQIESITVSWCEPDTLAQMIRDYDDPNYPTEICYGQIDLARVQSSEEHGTCHRCA